MAPRSSARLLAPVALVACTVAVVAVIDYSVGGAEPSAPRPPVRTGGEGEEPGGSERREPRSRRRTYVVRAGDTPSTIAERTGIPLSRLLQLNPDLDARTLTPGQRLRLRR